MPSGGVSLAAYDEVKPVDLDIVKAQIAKAGYEVV